jgi:hypothetical protein
MSPLVTLLKKLCAPRLRKHRAGRHTPARTPRLEALEDRRLLSTFTVTNAYPSGPGSLAQAILDANATRTGTPIAPDVICFAVPKTLVPIPGTGPAPGNPLGPITLPGVPSPPRILFQFMAPPIHPGPGGLPPILDIVDIDGTTEPGFAGAPPITIDGSSAGPGVDGLVLTGGHSTVRGLVIGGFSGAGIHVTTNGNDTIAGNWIGTDFTGRQARANGHFGVEVEAERNEVGGFTTADRNVISSNTAGGVRSSVRVNAVDGNFIGTDVTGQAALGNGGPGVLIDGAWRNTIGRPGGGLNVISGNGGDGILVRNAQYPIETLDTENIIWQNLIGTDVTGTRFLGNDNGVVIDNSSWTFVGAGNTGAINVISGNRNNGVVLRGQNTQGDFVQSNMIGNNQGFGVLVDGQAQNITIGANLANLINSGFGNVITNNTRGGVSVGVADNVTIWDNSIFANGGPGITLGVFGNGSMPAPVVDSVSRSRGTITWHVNNAPPNSHVTVQFFQNSSSGSFGQTIIGFASATTSGSGSASGTLTLPFGTLAAFDFITATATGPDGTSPFSSGTPVGP